MVSRRTLSLLGFILVLLAACGGSLAAETLLISVHETVDGKMSPPPLPTDEAVTSILFEKGHIVFDEGGKGGSTAALTEAARSGGAGWLLKIDVIYTQKPLDQLTTRVDGSASFALIDSATGATSLSGSVKASNSGREKTVDRAALGTELARLVTDRVSKALPTPAL